ncbi:VOC family protein [Ramlibacter alkalitolerans]|uniref:VOC family protein n=1 Tax=Ramlibacter alkalitolerans TaxID=2039631 RepID=A0ABS1JQT4_9BURK|nr:VOC family protein [Ramlibacter alkalitolerans]MBL0426516.1 VOC family protein [Ramlibacter alkalitolerans]
MAANAFPGARGAVPVDHVIFHAGQALGELASFFERIGFTLTPLGRHSSGSVNRLAILEQQYLELIGFEPGTPATVRPEVQSLPLGLSGIAAADRAEHVRRAPPEAFLPSRRLERPVEMPGVHGVAAFTNTEVRAPAPDVRVFLCRHHTPELVWQPAWQRHANTATSVSEVRFATRDPRRLGAVLRTVFDVDAAGDDGGFDAAGTRIAIAAPGQRAALTLRTRSLQALQEVLVAAGVACAAEEGRVSVPLPEAYGAEIVFVAA